MITRLALTTAAVVLCTTFLFLNAAPFVIPRMFPSRYPQAPVVQGVKWPLITTADGVAGGTAALMAGAPWPIGAGIIAAAAGHLLMMTTVYYIQGAPDPETVGGQLKLAENGELA